VSIEYFTRLLLHSLMPAHALSYSAASSHALIPPVAASTSAARSASSNSNHTHFTTILHGRPVEWTVEYKSATAGITPTLFAIRVHAPSHTPSTVVNLRACILRRLQLVLFGAAASSSSAISSDAASLPSVSLRHMAALPSNASDAEREAHQWMMQYLTGGRDAAATSNSPSAATRNGVASIFAGATPAASPTLHYQRVHESLTSMQSQIDQLQSAHAATLPPPIDAVVQLYLQTRMEPITAHAPDTILNTTSAHTVLA
jgi:hypothetical protein